MSRVGSHLRRLRKSDDILDPRSRHNIHVTRAADLDAVGPWSGETLVAAVRRADGEERVVVIDYGRHELYLAAGTELTYEPPQRLGLAAPPELYVAEPHRIDLDHQTTTAIEPVVVSPKFDILVPAFDWEELSDDDMLPPTNRQPSGTSVGSGTGTPG
ncbi:hypothetical protein ACFQMF_10875 [Halorubrum rutilum]|uniref:Uncharacterized protein n=1 Tax=Halorubrum rutilum TaxID=1364933 RepID=A0ABD6AP02_9EURY|nr:hypothetical protein [Halorubrum rutilum]